MMINWNQTDKVVSFVSKPFYTEHHYSLQFPKTEKKLCHGSLSKKTAAAKRVNGMMEK